MKNLRNLFILFLLCSGGTLKLFASSRDFEQSLLGCSQCSTGGSTVFLGIGCGTCVFPAEIACGAYVLGLIPGNTCLTISSIGVAAGGVCCAAGCLGCGLATMCCAFYCDSKLRHYEQLSDH